MLYVLVGGPFEIMDTPHKIEVFGQPVEIPDDLARQAIVAGALLLPADKFSDHGFTAEELAKYTNSRVQANAPAEFHKKHGIALEAARSYRAQLLAEPASRQAAAGSKDKS